MNKIIVFFCLLFFSVINAQQKIIFNYDSAGNQFLRELCLSGCSSTAKSSKEVKEIEALTEDDLLKFSKNDVISYYPNPVKEELYVKWQLEDNHSVESIYVYNIAGQLLKEYKESPTAYEQNISFQNYAAGVYAVVLNYNNGEQKSIKIIKQ